MANAVANQQEAVGTQIAAAYAVSITTQARTPRTIDIDAEDRVLVITDLEDRVLVLAAEDRILTVK